MGTLLLVEARRALSRRLVRILIVAALTVTAIAGVVVFLNSSDEAPGPRTAAEAMAARQDALRECLHFEGDVRICERQVPPAAAFGIEEDDRFHLTDLWAVGGEDDAVLHGTAVPLVIAALIAGASVVGAEWRAGTMGLLLTWEPRRTRVLLAKATVVFVLAAAIGLALQLVFVGALLPSALWRGTTAGADADFWRSLAGGVLRIAGVAGLAALAGACIASIGRNTAAGIGAAFAHLAVLESSLRGLKPGWSGWFLSNNAAIVITGDPDVTIEVTHSVLRAGLTLAVYGAVLVGTAIAVFRARDVT